MDKLLTLVEANLLARSANASALSKVINFEELIDAIPVSYDAERIKELS